jgi:hypothetical protein
MQQQNKPTWENHAACKGLDPNLFVRPTDENTGQNTDTAPHPLALSACTRCPVITACLNDVLDRPGEYGTWAATGPAARRYYRRLKLAAGHQYQPACACDYCTALPAHADRLRNPNQPAELRLVNSNGTGATCGHRSTYGRNCRCNACTHANNLAWRRTTVSDDVVFDVTTLPRRRTRACPHVDVGECNACVHNRTLRNAA